VRAYIAPRLSRHNFHPVSGLGITKSYKPGNRPLIRSRKPGQNLPESQRNERSTYQPRADPVVARPLPFALPGGWKVKKLFALILTIAILAVAAAPSFAQGRNRQCNTNARTYNSRTYNSRTYYDSQVYDANRSAYYDYGSRNRSFWGRHRDKLTVAIGTGAGAAIGALVGGKRGAVIGAAAGAGGSALYTYRIRNRGYRY